MLKSFPVTNEGAERGMKLVADFLGQSKREDICQTYLQVVEQHKMESLNLRQHKRKSKNHSS